MSSPYSPPEHSDDPVEEILRPDVRGMQIVTLALAGGAMFFMAIVLGINQGALGFEPDVASWIGLGFAAILFINHLIVPRIITSQTLKQIDSNQLSSLEPVKQTQIVLPAYRQQLIVACALLEGAAFMNLTMYMTEQYVGSIAVAAFLIAVIVLKLPTASRLTDWARQRIQEIEMR